MPPEPNQDIPATHASRTAERCAHWDSVAARLDSSPGWGGCYHRRLADVYRLVIPEGASVLELGCAQGDLLAALRPGRGVGVDFSTEMIRRARERHPDLEFILADVHEIALNETFDFIILSDLVNDLVDVQAALQRLHGLVHPRSRVILNLHSQMWRGPLTLARRFGLATPLLPQNWLTAEDAAHMLYLADFELLRVWQEVLSPLPCPLLTPLLNRWMVKLWPCRFLALTNVLMARPAPVRPALAAEPLVSVIVPARNEAGNIEAVFRRTPDMGRGTELVFVEGGSSDNTAEAITQAIAAHPERKALFLRQTGKGKGDAVRLGFERASGDILMILDADLTMPPEALPRFYEALRSGKADLVNGVRLVYPMDKKAMRFLNLLANKSFSLAFSWLLGQPIKDTLCGTKAMWASDYARIAANRAYFGDFDPFGDFDLLFGAAKLNMRLVDLPIRYEERTYGTTNIHRWRHGVLLLRMVLFAANRIKFV
ncbi:MAG: glycosyl transferase [Lentisphaerae bacterium RIFOXYB12_FULL_65_16]|nr:MAG: glycosyl transferase [Lentisphaerae bacterium RIFOXYA12_64_32]OGV92922.1 MAG: glycosyl transferase [Lentisphaerae bacterium RIFOXYB12_FULL_65_16]